MSSAALKRLEKVLGDKIVETSDLRDDFEATVAVGDWVEAAGVLRDDPELALDHFLDLTAVDYPEREPEAPRFDVLLTVRSMTVGHRVRLRTQVGEDEPMPTLVGVYPGTNWAEREVWDMFGIPFEGHPDLRRILMYEEFDGHPLRKDYPIEQTQPLVPYRTVEGIDKLPPFGPDMGQPFGRVDWQRRLAGEDIPVSPSLGVQFGVRPALSASTQATSPQAESTEASEEAEAAATEE
jgi:NADH-quinone oxidoreductase subunit C